MCKNLAKFWELRSFNPATFCTRFFNPFSQLHQVSNLNDGSIVSSQNAHQEKIKSRTLPGNTNNHKITIL